MSKRLATISDVCLAASLVFGGAALIAMGLDVPLGEEEPKKKKHKTQSEIGRRTRLAEEKKDVKPQQQRRLYERHQAPKVVAQMYIEQRGRFGGTIVD